MPLDARGVRRRCPRLGERQDCLSHLARRQLGDLHDERRRHGPDQRSPATRQRMRTRLVAGRHQDRLRRPTATASCEIYTMNADGTARPGSPTTPTTDDCPPGRPTAPRSPSRASATATTRSTSMNADGTGQTRLTDNPADRPVPRLVARRHQDRLHDQPRRQLRDLHDERRRQRARPASPTTRRSTSPRPGRPTAPRSPSSATATTPTARSTR